jgi:hypothetical protein
MKPLVTPLVNLNGATAKSLIEQHVAVMNALDTVLEAMSQAFPHGRDFQTHPDGNAAVYAARDAWQERMLALTEMKREITDNALAIQAQGRN